MPCMACPVCHVSLTDDARYCWECGAPQPDLHGPAARLEHASAVCVHVVVGGDAGPFHGEDAAGAHELHALVEAIVTIFLERGAQRVQADVEVADGAFVVLRPTAATPQDLLEAAMHAATRARALVRQQASRAWAEAGIPVELRVGISSGLLCLTESGDAVGRGLPFAMAARLAGSAGPDDILLDEATAIAVGGRVALVAEDPLSEANGALCIPVWRLDVESLPMTMPPRQLLGDRSSRQLIGREAEVTELRRQFRGVVRDGRLRRVLVTGAPGSGRTRLIREVVDQLRGSHTDLRVAEVSLHGRDVPGAPFGVLGGLVSSALLLELATDEDERQRRLDAELDALAETSPELDDPFLRARLCQLAALTTDAEGIPADPEHASASAYGATLSLLSALANRRPLLIVAENVGAGTPDQRQALLRLADGLRERSAMLVMSTPLLPGDEQAWPPPDAVDHSVALGPLSPEAGRVLLDQVLGRRDALPREVADEIVAHTGGVPLFIEEALSSLIEVGLLVEVPSTGAWRLSTGQLPDGFPQSLTALMQARLDQMPELEAEVLRSASVVGERFWSGLIAELGEPQAALHLRRLQERGLITRDYSDPLPGQSGFRFAHRAARAIVRAEVPESRARLVHTQVARWLARNAGDRFHPWLAVIAWHFGGAGDEARAASYHVEAGRWARSRGDLGQALDQFERAARLAPNDDARMEAALDLAEVRVMSGRHREAQESLESLFAWASARRDVRSIARCLVLLARVANGLGRPEEVDALAERTAALADALGPSPQQGALLLERARADRQRGRDAAALDKATQVMRLATDAGEPLRKAQAAVVGALAMVDALRFAECVRALDEAADLAREVQHPGLRAAVALGRGWAAWGAGDLDAAEEAFGDAMARSRWLTDGDVPIEANCGRALVAAYQERYTEAANLAASALDEASAAGRRTLEAFGRVIIGHVYGRVETTRHRLKARELSEAAIRHARTDRRAHLVEGRAALLERGAPTLWKVIASLALAEYALAVDPDDEAGRSAAEDARALVSAGAEGPLVARANDALSAS
ncbi:MAG: AAA family ATPase [Deltaproteobacteria bacterium]|nr:AAA family ATPase [Deltaproteobacteria bacterium]MCB9785839.1 AAA family ATPase [Deltaproteobacteria bacterium]